MAADGVKRERRAAPVHRADVTVGEKSQLHEGLEAVADAQDEAVVLVEKDVDSFGDLWRTEERCDELCGAIRFVASRKSSGNHEDLAGANLFC